MTHDVDVTAALRRAAVSAVRAPSVHNSQPWRVVLGPDSLWIRPDRERQASVFDPTGRQLLISCGCAAANAQVALAGDGRAATVRFEGPRGAWPSVQVAVEPGPCDDALAALEPFVDVRATPRAPMAHRALPPMLRSHLRDLAAVRGIEFGVVDGAERAAVEGMAALGTRVLCTYPEYLAELRAWTTGPARADGLASTVLDVLAGGSAAAADAGWAGPDSACEIVYLATARDDPPAWIAVGLVLERILLELTRVGLSAIPLAQIVEVPTQRAGFAARVGTTACPQAVLRVGLAPSGAPTRRRRLVDVIE